MNNKVTLVDIYDNKLGEMDKLEAHKKPTLHSAFSVFLIDGTKMLLQKRAKHKYHSGGLWANACCSHPSLNMGLIDCVKERMGEELAINEELNMAEVFSFIYFSKYAEDLYEYEYDHVFVADYDSTKPVAFNPEEIEEVKWVEFEDLKQDLLNNPQNYSTWFLIAAPKVIKFIEVFKNTHLNEYITE